MVQDAVARMTKDQRIQRCAFAIAIVEGDDAAICAYQDWLIDQQVSEEDTKFLDPPGWIGCRGTIGPLVIKDLQTELDQLKKANQ